LTGKLTVTQWVTGWIPGSPQLKPLSSDKRGEFLCQEGAWITKDIEENSKTNKFQVNDVEKFKEYVETVLNSTLAQDEDEVYFFNNYKGFHDAIEETKTTIKDIQPFLKDEKQVIIIYENGIRNETPYDFAYIITKTGGDYVHFINTIFDKTRDLLKDPNVKIFFKEEEQYKLGPIEMPPDPNTYPEDDKNFEEKAIEKVEYRGNDKFYLTINGKLVSSKHPRKLSGLFQKLEIILEYTATAIGSLINTYTECGLTE
jgi:hypothetical protein